jgi:hypothetical protein
VKKNQSDVGLPPPRPPLLLPNWLEPEGRITASYPRARSHPLVSLPEFAILGKNSWPASGASSVCRCALGFGPPAPENLSRRQFGPLWPQAWYVDMLNKSCSRPESAQCPSAPEAPSAGGGANDTSPEGGHFGKPRAKGASAFCHLWPTLNLAHFQGMSAPISRASWGRGDRVMLFEGGI